MQGFTVFYLVVTFTIFALERANIFEKVAQQHLPCVLMVKENEREKILSSEREKTVHTWFSWQAFMHGGEGKGKPGKSGRNKDDGVRTRKKIRSRLGEKKKRRKKYVWAQSIRCSLYTISDCVRGNIIFHVACPLWKNSSFLGITRRKEDDDKGEERGHTGVHVSNLLRCVYTNICSGDDDNAIEQGLPLYTFLWPFCHNCFFIQREKIRFHFPKNITKMHACVQQR